MSTIQTVAIIPARGGSKGIPLKNLQEVGGKPLVVRSIEAAKQSTFVDLVCVSTDSPEIAAVSEKVGARIIHRPQAIAGDQASSESALIHVLEVLAQENIKPEYLLFLQATSPFTTSEDIDKLGAVLKEDSNCKVTFSVTEDHSFLWSLDSKGYAIGMNHDHTKARKRRQDLPPQFRETGAAYAMRCMDFSEKQNRFCGNAKAVCFDSIAIDIDTISDLELARKLCPT